jgi:polyhydroxyalkanoate synthase
VSPFRAALTATLALATTACGSVPLTAHGEVAHPVTRDGWALTIEHFPPAPGTPARKRPVVLCHGILSNRHFFELEGDGSLPLVLSRDGFDVWLVDMRGRQDAGSPGWYFGEHTYSYDVDAFVREDMDTMLAYVVGKTGAHDVTWVGHSLSGMIAYARLGSIGDARIGALVTVGSPGFFGPASLNSLRFYKLSGALAVLPVLSVQTPAWIDAKLRLSLAPSILTDSIVRLDGIPRVTYEALEEHAVSDGSKAELRQLLRGIRSGDFVSADGRVSYTERLSEIHTPALVIVGRGDEVTDPLIGRGVFERLGSSDKELVIAGRGEGFSTDFGHVDLMVGPAARREIFPRIVRWLEEHDAR